MEKVSKTSLALLFAAFIFGISSAFIFPKIQKQKVVNLAVNHTLSDVTVSDLPKKVFEYGMRIDTFDVYQKLEIKRNEFVSEILDRFHVDPLTVHELTKNSKNYLDFKKFQSGNPYTILAKTVNEDTVGQYLIYEKNKIEYLIYNLNDPNDITINERPTERVERSVSGEIEGTLWNSLIDANTDPDLAVKLAHVYQWTLDFTRIQEGDQYKAVYDEIYVDGEYYRTDSIKAAFLHHKGRDYYAFYFDQGDDKLKAGFYDENGESLKRAFLTAPVKYSRISSRYSGRRFHPVQKRYKAHLGTDYAAPSGTPIYATANGVVIAASYTRGNGNYVKIKHNKTYTTQYLHMSKRAVRKGNKVQQGEVIGYVGSTGLATGPHVCYRFWKNGRQVDHLKLDLPSGDPIKKEHMAAFEQQKDMLLKKMNTANSTFYIESTPIIDEAGIGLFQ